jgi:hypothetical protein
MAISPEWSLYCFTQFNLFKPATTVDCSSSVKAHQVKQLPIVIDERHLFLLMFGVED